MLKTLIAAAVLALAATPASAEVFEKHDDAFVLMFEATVDRPPDAIYGAIGRIDRWWDSAHTYSGSAGNLSLALEPGGCWCEALADGTTFEHGRVVTANPDSMVGINAPFGPLKGRATTSDFVLSWRQENGVWTLRGLYVVQGAGLGAMAEPVDGVMQIQFDNLVKLIRSNAG